MGAAVDDKPPLQRGGRQTRQKSADALKQLLLWKEGGRHCSLSCLFRLPSSAKAVFVLGCFVYLSTCCKPILCTDAPEASSVRQNFSTIETTENVEQHAVSEINSSQNSDGSSAGLAEAEGRNRSQGTEGERSVPSNRAGREILFDRHAAFPKAIRVGERFGELESSQPGKSRVVQESASSSRSVSVVQHSPFRDTENSDEHCDASIDEDKILFLRQHKRGGGYVRVPVLISSRFLPAAFGLRLYKRATLGQHLKVSSEKATAPFNTTTSNTSSDDSSHSSALPPSSNLLSAAPASSDETPAASTEGNDTFNALPVFFPPSVVEEATRPLGIAVRPPVVAIPAGATDFEVQIQLQRKPRGQTVTVQIDCYALSPVKPVLSSQEKELTGQDAFSSDGPSDGRYPDGSSGTGVGNSKNEAQEAMMTANIGTGDSKPASASQKGLILSAREEIKRQAWKQRHWRTIHVKEATNARCRVSARSSDPDEEVVVKRGTFIELLSLTKALPVHSETVKGDKRNSRPAGAATDDNNFPPPPTQPSLSGGERPWWSLSREYPVNVYIPPQNRKQRCQPGTLRALAGTSCLPCMPGFRCYDEKHYESCAFPTWSPEGSATCLTPGPHTNSMGVGSAPIPCGEGTVSTEASAKCMLCPVNHKCVVDRIGIETPCPKKTFSDPGEAECRYCPKNHDCTKGVIQPCPFGQVSDKKGTGCVDVTDGSYLDPDSKRARTLPQTFANDGTGRSFTWLYVTKAFTGWVPGTGSSSKKVPCPPMALCTAGWYKLGVLKNQWSSSKDVLNYGAAVPAGWSSIFDQPSADRTKQMFGYYGWARNSISFGDDDFASPDNPCPTGYYSDNTMNFKKECVRADSGYCPRGSLSDCRKHEFPALLSNTRGSAHDDIYAVRTGYHALRSVKGKEEVVKCNEGHIIYGRTCYTGTLFGKPGRPGMMFKWRKFFESHTANREDLLDVCPEGHYCPVPSVVTKVACPEGTVCPQGTKWKHQYSCLPGTYAPTAVTSEQDCQACPPGFGCPIGNELILCEIGFFCPAGTPHPAAYPCPKGTYGATAGLHSQSACSPCPVGFVCDGGTSLSLPCPKGHYCPAQGLSSQDAVACPEGTYNPSSEARAAGSCLPCPLGYACDGPGAWSKRQCGRGTYSGEGEAACKPCPGGSFCEIGSAPQLCPAGSYSDVGADSCVACDVKYRCDTPGLSKYEVLLERFCPSCDSSSVSRDSITTAPGGFWLDASTGLLTACEPGSYTVSDGATSAAHCVASPAGTYVSYFGAPETEGRCSRGYYCPAGSTSREQIRCPSGTYSTSPGAGRLDECVACPAGSRCLQMALTDIRSDCPPGFYCPEGSTFRGVSCPAGTFRAQSQGRELADCMQCPPGMYCPEPGLSAPAAPCSAGYVCLGGASSPAPIDNITGQVCPAGGFCPEGATANAPCPAGTYNPLPGGRDASSCLPCPAGQYCLGTTNTTPDGDCEDGHICPEGSSSPTETPASPGHYAVHPFVTEEKCRRGSFTEKYGQSECTPCLPGSYCNDEGMSRVKTCPAGTFCPEASLVTQECPVGTYSPVPLRGSIDDCIACPPGHYCSKSRATQPRGPCAPGFFCQGGATTDRPAEGSGQGGPCPVGHYCPAETEVPTPCPPGTYGAMQGQRGPGSCLPCPGATFCSQAGLSTFEGLCAGGFTCPSGSIKQKHTLCPAGSKCPPGSVSPTACPAGTYQPDEGQEDCLPCPPGYKCPSRQTAFLNSPCPEGTVCPDSSTTEPQQCPDGTYSVLTARIHMEACLPCPPGLVCQLSNAKPDTTGTADCPAGYACSGGVKATGSGVEGEGAVRCEKGFYCPRGTGEPIPCPAGKVCAAAQLGTADVPCPGGRYCPMQSSEGFPCPAGYYCPQGSAAPLRCPLGTISTYTENAAEAQCTKCPPGKFCDGTTNGLEDQIDSTAFSGECRKGYFCPEGLYTAIGTPCPIGFHCPAGSATPLACPLGSTTAAAGLSECTGCDAGFICSDGNVQPCPVGQYCTADSLPQDCPSGTYNPIAGGIDFDACRPCPPGKACRRSRTSKPETCRAGYFCLSEVTVLNPTTLSEAQSIAVAEGETGAATEGGGRCPKGYYCPAGTRVPLPCSAGHHCGTLGLADPRAPCSAGYYCRRKANSASPPAPAGATSCPSQDHYGACTPGHFCPSGSRVPEACPPGTYRSLPLGKSAGDCVPCPGGRYCSGRGLVSPTGSCRPGVFCTKAAETPDGTLCPEGHYCLEGTVSPKPCAAGTYQATVGHTSCRTCPKGFLCGPGTGTVTPVACPPGHFCPASTSKPSKCPAGKYSLVDGLAEEANCSWCPPGNVCTAEGVATELKRCPAGSYCPAPDYVLSPATGGDGSSGAFKVTCASSTGGVPTCAIDALECPLGYVCPEGSATAKRCPLGQTVAVSGAATNSGCKPCPAGQFCSPSGAVEPCADGFLCISGAYRPKPLTAKVGRLCRAGHFCPSGTTVEIACLRGTLSVGEGSGNACDECPPGNVCDAEGIKALDDHRACPAGSYCPPGSVTAIPCPAGTYSAFTYLASSQECLACPAGKYCESAGAHAVTGPCDAGTWCKRKSTKQNHSGGYAPSSLVACPQGAYCLQASPMPILCQLGTYQDEEATADACKPCAAGTFCGSAGLTTEAGSGPCQAGFFCKEGAKVAAPRDKSTGDICKKGHHCPSGSKAPQACPPGYYSDEEGLATCKPCPAGSLCPGGTNGEIGGCPAGSFCKAAVSAAAACPDGTTSEVESLAEEGQCADCPAGKVCEAGKPPASCPEGFLCLAGVGPKHIGASNADIDELWLDSTFWSGHAIHYGGACPPGHFCPRGATAPEPCAQGTVREQTGGKSQADCTKCPIGSFCDPRMPVPVSCPPGYYCPEDTQEPSPCEAGSYLTTSGHSEKSACTICPEGYACNRDGVVDYKLFPCPTGYFCGAGVLEPEACPAGTYGAAPKLTRADLCEACPPGIVCTTRDEEDGARRPQALGCPAGYVCPKSTSTPTLCPAGTFCPRGTSTPRTCPAGYFCPEGAETPVLCSKGTFCLEGATEPSVCPAGYKAKDSCVGAYSVEACCEPCPVATYSDRPGATHCSPCAAGYICKGGATTAKPSAEETSSEGYVCPPGYYCLEGASEPTPCPAGTFRDQPGGEALDGCSPCPHGTFQRFPGMASCTKCGEHAVSEKSVGSTTCTCLGISRFYQIEDGTCPCYARSSPQGGEPQESQDGRSPCEAKLYPRCASGSHRDDFGACVFEAEVECGESCRGGSGSFLAAFGVCQCADGPRIAAQCTSTCKEQLPQVFVSDAGFEEIDSVQGSKTVYSEGLPPDIDLAHLQFLCNKLKEGLRGLPLTSLCGVSFHQASSAGLDGLLRMPEEFRPAHGSRNYEDSQDTFAGTQVQLRRSISSASFKRPRSRQRATDPRHVVPRPVQCLQRGSTIIWELKDGVYPVYHKESLMNTHPAMDDGPFRELAQTAPILPQFFAYTFLVAGSFVFAASDNPLEIAVVVVVPDGVRCPAASTFAAPLSTQSLGILGVTTASQRVMTEPNWGVVFLGVFAVAACCLLAFYAVWRCRHSAWEVRVWTAPLGSANRIPNDDFKSVLAALDGLPGATGNLRCTDTRLVHHVVVKPAEPLLETTGKTTSASDDAPIIPLKDAADALVVDIESTDTRLLQVMFEKLLDFGNILKRLVEDEVKAVKAACDVMPQTLERILRRTRQTLLLLPNEHMWAISPSQAKLLQALACVFTEGDNSPAVGEALANALTPHTLESSQVSKGGDLPGSLLACVDLAGVAVFDAFDCLWLLEPQHGEDSVADRVLGKLEKLLEGNDPLEENSDSLFVIYDTLFAERAYQEERLRRECTRVQSRFAGVMQKFKDTCQTLHLLPAKQAQAWFELKDFQLRELLDFEAKASRSIVEAAVGGVRSGKAMLNDNLLTTTLEMDPSNSRAFLSGILASSRKTLLDQIRQQLAAALKEVKQLLKRQDAALMELLSEHARSYRTAAEARRRACRALLQQKHTEEKQRLKRWSATMVKAVKETRNVPAEMQGNAREEQERLDMETALEQVHRATAHRRQLGEDRQRLENQMADAAFSTAVDLHEAHLDFLRDQTRMEYQLLEASSREDHEIHSDFAVELGTLQLEALVMSVMKRAARQEATGQCETTLDEVLETEMEGWNGQTVVTALQAVQSKVTKQQSASREISASLVAKGKQASEALTRCVANRYDLMTQAIDQIQGKSFQLALSALEAREDTWKAALSAAGRLALNDAERQTSEKEVLRQLEVQKTVEADDEFEKTQLLQELLEKNCHTRLRTVTQLRRAMLQTRLKAWAAVALHGGFFDKVKALQSWKEVADHRSQEDDALAAIRDQRRQAMGKYVMRVRKLVIREEKRRVHQKESLAHAAFVVTQPRTVTGKALGTAGGVLQGAVEMLAHKKLDDEFTRRRSALKAELRRELEAIDEEIKRHQEIIEAEADDLSGADDEVPQETVSMGGSVSELGNAEGGQSVRKKRNSEMENRLSLLDRQRAEIVNLFNENERQLESEWRTRAVHVRHEILQKITDFAVELESSGQQLDSIAAEVARDVTVQYQEELKELEGTRDAPVAEQDNNDGFEEGNKDADAAPPEGDLDQKLRHLAMVRCQRVILRLKRLVEKGSKMARSLSEEASAELRRLQKEEREKEAERRVELERELQQHEREKVEAEKRLAESLESLQREWEERLERTQEEGRARLRELQEAARREAGRKVGDQNLGAIKQEIFARHQEDATRFDEALGAEYWKQMNRLRERLQVKMMARKRRLAAAAQEQLSIEGDRLKEARNAFVAQQESISFYDPDKQREVVLRIGRAWRDEARRRTAQKKANAEADQIATEDAEPQADLPPLQKLSTSVLNKRLAGMRRAIEDTIAEMHGTMQSISTTDGRRSTSSRPTIHQFESLVDATGQISQVSRSLSAVRLPTT